MMALITRLSRLFTADLHAVLDRMEEPEIVLKQAIRDMQAAVAAAERQIRALRSRAEHIAATTANAETRLGETDEALNACLDAGNEDLARSVIQRKLQLERNLAELEAQSQQVHKALDEHDRTLARRQQELEALRSKAEVFESAERDGADPIPTAAVTREEVEVALLREKQRRARS
jgi:phage shock protein A